MSTQVTFVIVNYNGERFIQTCLDSILAQSRPPDEIILVDNASCDHSPLLVREHFPQVELILLDDNIGFPAACNRGIHEASGDLIAILNNDVTLDPNWLESLLEHDVEPWDFWASQILFAFDPEHIDSAGDGMAIVGAAYKIGHGDPANQHQQLREVFGPCAAAALYRRSMLQELEGFDPDFFLIYEDADLNMRARLQGYRCLYVPQARVFHHVNSSIQTFSDRYVFFGHRNSEYVFWKNMPGPLLLLYLPERLIFDLLSFLFFLFKGRSSSFVRAKADFLRNLSKVIQKHRAVQQERKLSIGQFRKLLDHNWIKYRKKAVPVRTQTS